MLEILSCILFVIIVISFWPIILVGVIVYGIAILIERLLNKLEE